MSATNCIGTQLPTPCFQAAGNSVGISQPSEPLYIRGHCECVFAILSSCLWPAMKKVVRFA